MCKEREAPGWDLDSMQIDAQDATVEMIVRSTESFARLLDEVLYMTVDVTESY